MFKLFGELIMTSLSEQKKTDIIKELSKRFSVGENFTIDEVRKVYETLGFKWNTGFLSAKNYISKVSRGNYCLISTLDANASQAVKKSKKPVACANPYSVQKVELEPVLESTSTTLEMAKDTSIEGTYIPKGVKSFVKHGFYQDLKKVVQSELFYPIFITGLSGNGKTTTVEQVCSELKREMIRVNLTAETDEDDLLGGFRLVDGATKWFDGPIIKAMKRGAVLLLDEVDLSSVKIMCLQPILEGKPVFLKKISTIVEPRQGFNIIATANTKGQGCDSGKFIGTNILNEAFLDRFPLTFEQGYPDVKIEEKILFNNLDLLKVKPTEEIKKFVSCLCAWASLTRAAFEQGEISEVISTRRLIYIVTLFTILQDKKKAIEFCITRFDEETKATLVSLYEKFDYEINTELKDVMNETISPEFSEETIIKKDTFVNLATI